MPIHICVFYFKVRRVVTWMSAWVVRATRHLKFNLQRRGVASLWKRCQAMSLLMSLAHWATSPAFNGKLNFMSTVIPSEKECLTTSIHTYTEEHADALEIEPHFAKPPSRVPSPTAMKQVGWGTWLQTTLSCCRWATPPAFNEELDFCWWWKTKVCHRNRKHV